MFLIKWLNIRHKRILHVASTIAWHCSIFSADADVRLARRIRRDTVEKGRDIGTVLDQVRDLLFLRFESWTNGSLKVELFFRFLHCSLTVLLKLKSRKYKFFLLFGCLVVKYGEKRERKKMKNFLDLQPVPQPIYST
jgi:hypothetical protein